MSFPVNDPQDQTASSSGYGPPVDANPGPQVPAQPTSPPAEHAHPSPDQTVLNPFAPAYQPPNPAAQAYQPANPAAPTYQPANPAAPAYQPVPLMPSAETSHGQQSYPQPGSTQVGPPGPYFGDTPSPPTAPPRKRSGATVVFAVLTVLLLLGLAALGAFFVTTKNSTDKKLADQKAQIERLESDLKAKGAELSRTQDDLEEAEQDLEDADKCVDAVRNFFRSESEFQARKRAEVMFDKC